MMAHGLGFSKEATAVSLDVRVPWGPFCDDGKCMSPCYGSLLFSRGKDGGRGRGREGPVLVLGSLRKR